MAQLSARCLVCFLVVLPAAGLRRRDDPPAPEAAQATVLAEKQKSYTAEEAQEEIATKFINTPTFQEKLLKWCKKDRDLAMCRMKNSAVHYCPTLYKAAPEAVNRTELVGRMVEILDRAGKVVENGIFQGRGTQQFYEVNALLQASAASHPHKHHRHEESVQAAAPAKRAQGVQAKTQTDGPANVNSWVKGVEDPYPEVSNHARYQRRVTETCSGSRAKEAGCKAAAGQEILCLTLSQATLELIGLDAIVHKMEDTVKESAELQFKMHSG